MSHLSESTNARAALALPDKVPSPPSAKRPSWRQVESADYRQYIANMRALDIPEETVRDIVLADINKLYDSRKRDLLKSTIRDEFWRPGGTGRHLGPIELDALRGLAAEKESVIKELLGLETS